MVYKKPLDLRREKVANLLAQSISSPTKIAAILQISAYTVQNDLSWLKAQTKPWLYGLAENGYAFDCKILIEKLQGIEEQLEEMRQTARKNNAPVFEQIAILRELREVSIARINTEGKGPVLLTLRKVIRGDFKTEELKNA